MSNATRTSSRAGPSTGSPAPIVVLLPVKDIIDAKQRLSPVLTPLQRQALFIAMFEDVLTTVIASTHVARVVVRTRDAHARHLAARFGAHVQPETTNAGQTAAVAAGAAELAAQGVSAMLAIPADIPTLSGEDVAALAAAHGLLGSGSGERPPDRAVTIGPARDRLGSNAMLCSPPDVMTFRFGDNSFYPHLDAARTAGVVPRIVERAGIGLDIDTPYDLKALAASRHACRALDTLRSFDLEIP